MSSEELQRNENSNLQDNKDDDSEDSGSSFEVVTDDFEVISDEDFEQQYLSSLNLSCMQQRRPESNPTVKSRMLAVIDEAMNSILDKSQPREKFQQSPSTSAPGSSSTSKELAAGRAGISSEASETTTRTREDRLEDPLTLCYKESSKAVEKYRRTNSNEFLTRYEMLSISEVNSVKPKRNHGLQIDIPKNISFSFVDNPPYVEFLSQRSISPEVDRLSHEDMISHAAFVSPDKYLPECPEGLETVESSIRSSVHITSKLKTRVAFGFQPSSLMVLNTEPSTSLAISPDDIDFEPPPAVVVPTVQIDSERNKGEKTFNFDFEPPLPVVVGLPTVQIESKRNKGEKSVNTDIEPPVPDVVPTVQIESKRNKGEKPVNTDIEPPVPVVVGLPTVQIDSKRNKGETSVNADIESPPSVVIPTVRIDSKRNKGEKTVDTNIEPPSSVIEPTIKVDSHINAEKTEHVNSSEGDRVLPTSSKNKEHLPGAKPKIPRHESRTSYIPGLTGVSPNNNPFVTSTSEVESNVYSTILNVGGFIVSLLKKMQIQNSKLIRRFSQNYLVRYMQGSLAQIEETVMDTMKGVEKYKTERPSVEELAQIKQIVADSVKKVSNSFSTFRENLYKMSKFVQCLGQDCTPISKLTTMFLNLKLLIFDFGESSYRLVGIGEEGVANMADNLSE